MYPPLCRGRRATQGVANVTRTLSGSRLLVMDPSASLCLSQDCKNTLTLFSAPLSHSATYLRPQNHKRSVRFMSMARTYTYIYIQCTNVICLFANSFQSMAVLWTLVFLACLQNNCSQKKFHKNVRAPAGICPRLPELLPTWEIKKETRNRR